MLTSGMLRFGSTGRVLVDLTSTPTHFNGGTPCLDDGTLCGSEDDPDHYLDGFGYKTNGAICARDAIPDGTESGLARTGVGSLALALDDPIVGYIAGIPVAADGRMTVELVSPPPLGPFSDGFSEGFA